jgi:hypothetical protein
LERENARLKKIVADQLLNIDMLKELGKDAPIDCQVVSRVYSVRSAPKTSLAR